MVAVVNFSSNVSGVAPFFRTVLVSFPPPSLIPKTLQLVGDPISTNYLVMSNSNGVQHLQFSATSSGVGSASTLSLAAYKVCFSSNSSGVGLECNVTQMKYGPNLTSVQCLDRLNMMRVRFNVHCRTQYRKKCWDCPCNFNYRQAHAADAGRLL